MRPSVSRLEVGEVRIQLAVGHREVQVLAVVGDLVDDRRIWKAQFVFLSMPLSRAFFRLKKSSSPLFCKVKCILLKIKVWLTK